MFPGTLNDDERKEEAATRRVELGMYSRLTPIKKLVRLDGRTFASARNVRGVLAVDKM